VEQKRRHFEKFNESQKYGVRIVALFQINKLRFTNACKEIHKKIYQFIN